MKNVLSVLLGGIWLCASLSAAQAAPCLIVWGLAEGTRLGSAPPAAGPGVVGLGWRRSSTTAWVLASGSTI
jgi:hypothetical protein